MDRKQRVLWDDNGTIRDISSEVNDFRAASVTLPIVAAQDKIYIGSELPFNHKYFDVSTPNALASVITGLELWNGQSWVAAIDVQDGTATPSTTTMAQDGALSWVPDPDRSSWGLEDDSTDIVALTAGPRILFLYWMRFGFSADLSAGLSLSYVGDVFSSDTDLAGYYPDTAKANLKTAWGVSNWQACAFSAGEEIVRDLRRRSVLRRREQIMDATLLTVASIHKTAAIIYGGLGSAYRDAAVRAHAEYVRAADLEHFELDQNSDGAADNMEKHHMATGFGSR